MRRRARQAAARCRVRASPEALAASYRSAHKKITEQGTQLAALLTENESLLKQVEEQQGLSARVDTLERRYLKTLAGSVKR